MYAVRSSAVGEDSEDTSAAGQNSTFLGIKSADEIVKYVAHCWASLYTRQSVEYRYKNFNLFFRATILIDIQYFIVDDNMVFQLKLQWAYVFSKWLMPRSLE